MQNPQRAALAAVRGSTDDLHKIEDIMDDNLSDPKMLGLLPVFYSNLDQANIPSGEDLDGVLSISTRQFILRAQISLNGVYIV
jgi:hypothetical protein